MYDENKTTITLGEKIETLLLKFHELNSENENLRNELSSTKAQNEAKDIEIAKLQEDIRAKTQETEELLAKIEAVLNI